MDNLFFSRYQQKRFSKAHSPNKEVGITTSSVRGASRHTQRITWADMVEFEAFNAVLPDHATGTIPDPPKGGFPNRR